MEEYRSRSIRGVPVLEGMGEEDGGVAEEEGRSRATPQRLHLAPSCAEGRFFMPQTRQTQFLVVVAAAPPPATELLSSTATAELV